MKTLALRLLAALLMVLPVTAHADPSDIAAASRSVVRVVLVSIEGRQMALVGHGSGVAITPDLILTNAHVVKEADESDTIRIGIVPSQGESGWFARIIAYSPQSDLALLKLTEAGTLPPATLFTGALEDGADVFAVGYPGNVDSAQGLGIADIVSPTAPVKTKGNISAGRSAKAFDTILHTAAIGAGNSGGPLLDSCGRVIGANSFGTVSGEGDSEFYFAVSMREISRFLLDAGVRPQTTGTPCRSIAELDRAEGERLAGERAGSEAQTRADSARRETAQHEAESRAQRAVISERDNGMALAGLALILALAAGGMAFIYNNHGKRRGSRIAMIAAGVLLIGAITAWAMRPSLNEIDERVRAAASDAPAPSRTEAATSARTGNLVCVLDTARSRVTVSPVTDVPISWTDDGCVNSRTQYGLSGGGWSRLLLPNDEDTATLASYDPQTGTYKTERYLLDQQTMAGLRAERAKYTPPSCSAGDAAARSLGDAQAAVTASLPGTPNERLVYNCRSAPRQNQPARTN
jgi:serine protease Do